MSKDNPANRVAYVEMHVRAFPGYAFWRIAALAVLIVGGGFFVFDLIGAPGSPDRASITGTAQAAKATGAMAVGAVSGLPLPRFVSLKSDEVNVRRGAGKEHDVLWTYHREGLPVEVIAEWDNWRRIRDADGADGWVFHSLLAGRRMALIAPWASEPTLPLRRAGEADAALVARLQPKVLASVETCSGQWCRIYGQGFDGWIEQERLFGVYPGEQF